mgnify:CR=1 FL=1
MNNHPVIATLPRPVPVAVALGSNLGNRAGMLHAALLSLTPLITIKATSSIHETEPWGLPDQPLYLNMAIIGFTDIPPFHLLSAFKQIERDLGRTPNPVRNAPRVIDIDLLLHGDTVLATTDLTLPHPHLHERRFVLAPLAEIAPTWVHPTLQHTIAELLAALPEDAC